MSTRRVKGTIASNAPLEVYGGLQIGDEVLDGLAEALRSGQLPFTFNHDALRKVRTSNFDAGVDVAPDGTRQVWVAFDIDGSDWQYAKAEFDRYGVPGAMSWSMTANPRSLGRRGDEPHALTIAADAGYFEAADIQDFASDLARLAPLEISEIYQFGAIPPALVVIEIQQQSDLWRDLLVGGASSIAATALLAFLKRLLRPLHRYESLDYEPQTHFHFKLEEPGRVLEFHLKTADADLLSEALEKLPAAAEQRRLEMKYDSTVRGWVPPT